MTCYYSLLPFVFCTSQTQRWSTLIVCIGKLKQQKSKISGAWTSSLHILCRIFPPTLNSFQFMHQTVHAGFLWAKARTTVGTFSILCRWCILYYNGTTQNCWNHWLVCLKVQPPELTWWKRFTCSSDKLSFRAHDRNICLDVQTGCGGFDSYRVRMVGRDVLGWWRTAW